MKSCAHPVKSLVSPTNAKQAAFTGADWYERTKVHFLFMLSFSFVISRLSICDGISPSMVISIDIPLRKCMLAWCQRCKTQFWDLYDPAVVFSLLPGRAVARKGGGETLS